MQHFYQTRINNIAEIVAGAIKAADTTVDRIEALKALEETLQDVLVNVQDEITVDQFLEAA